MNENTQFAEDQPKPDDAFDEKSQFAPAHSIGGDIVQQYVTEPESGMFEPPQSITSPFTPKDAREWARLQLHEDKVQHVAHSGFLGSFRKKLQGSKERSSHRIPAVLLAGALAVGACTQHTTVEATTTPRPTETAVTASPEVTKKPIENKVLHAVFSFGENSNLTFAEAQSKKAARAATQGLEQTLRGSRHFTLDDAGVVELGLSSKDIATLENSIVDVNEARTVFYEKIDAAVRNIATKKGKEAFKSYDAVMATVFMDSVDAPLYLEESGVDGTPIQTIGKREYVNDLPVILRIVTGSQNSATDLEAANVSTSIFAHEFGHGLTPEGLGHGKVAWCKGAYVFPAEKGGLPVKMPKEPCEITDYDDTTTVMGDSGSGQEWASGEWLNALQLSQLGVLKPGESVTLDEADFAQGQSKTYDIHALTGGDGPKYVALPPVKGPKLPVRDTEIPSDATMRPYLIVSPEYNEPVESGSNQAWHPGKAAGYSLKVIFAPDLHGKIIGSTYAVVLSGVAKDSTKIKDVGTPPNTLGDVFVDREGRTVSIEGYNKDGKPSIRVKITPPAASEY